MAPDTLSRHRAQPDLKGSETGEAGQHTYPAKAETQVPPTPRPESSYPASTQFEIAASRKTDREADYESRKAIPTRLQNTEELWLTRPPIHEPSTMEKGQVVLQGTVGRGRKSGRPKGRPVLVKQTTTTPDTPAGTDSGKARNADNTRQTPPQGPESAVGHTPEQRRP